MKTFLYGTTAMIAAAAVAGTASAQQAAKKPNEKITLQVGGYFEADYVFGDEARGQKACPIRNAATGAVLGCADPLGGGFASVAASSGVPAAVGSFGGVGGQGGVTTATVAGFGAPTNEPARGRRFQGIQREAEIYFRGQTTLDNGLTIGAYVQLEAETCQDQIDESYIYFSGSFGRVEYGSMDGVAFQMGYGAPAAVQGRSTFIINKRDWQLGGHSISSVNTAAAQSAGAQDAEKINYYTPRIAGFQFGISYTPDNCETTNTNGGGAGSVQNGVAAVAAAGTIGGCNGPQFANNPTQHSDIVDLSVNFVRKFGPVDVATNFFWTKGNLEGATGNGTLNAAGFTDGRGFTDRKEIGFGANLTYMGFTLGGGYRRDNLGVRSNNTDRTDYAVGLRYRTGPWQFGVDYGRAEQGQGIATTTTAGLANTQFAFGTRAGDDVHERFAAGVDYTMGPGIRFYGGLMYFNLDDNLSNPANENNGVMVILGTRLDF